MTTMLLLSIFITYLYLCGLTAYIAKYKGRDPVGYFFLSLLFSPLIGLLTAAVVRPDQARLERVRLASRTERKCPFCAELVKIEAKVCRFCGKDLPSSEPAPSGAVRRPEFGPKDRIRWGLVIAILAPVIALIVFGAIRHNRSSAGFFEDLPLGPGNEAYINGGRDRVPVAINEQSMRQADDAFKVSDATGVAKMMETEGTFFVEDGVRVFIVTRLGDRFQIRVLDGPAAQKTGWVPTKWVRR